MKRTMTMRKWAFWIFMVLYPGAMTFTIFTHKDTTDFIVSAAMGIVAMIAAFVAFYPKKRKTLKNLQTLKKTGHKPIPVFANQVFHKKDYDLLITNVQFHKDEETCMMSFLPADDNLERSIIFYRKTYPYIYDQLFEFNGQDVYPLLATITYSNTENAYYFKHEL